MAEAKISEFQFREIKDKFQEIKDKKLVKILFEIFVLAVFIYLIPMFIRKTFFGNAALTVVAGYLFIAFPYLVLRYIVSTFYKPYKDPPAEPLRVSIVVPFFNEEPKNLVLCAKSLMQQDIEISELIFVDDGSSNDDGLKALEKIFNDQKENSLNVKLIRLPRNEGKRRAFYEGFIRSSGEIIVTCDSDTIYPRDFVKNLLKPFADPKIKAVTGQLKCRNYKKNVLTRLYEARLRNAYLIERAFQSIFGSVLVCSGPCSAFRREIIEKYKDSFLNQRFLGRVQTYGDDRALTNFSLKEGRVVFQSTAIAYTLAPERFDRFIKQQIRWSRSFIRETLIAIADVGIKNRKLVPLCLSTLELTLVLLFGISFVSATVSVPEITKSAVFVYYLTVLFLNSIGRNIRIATSQGKQSYLLFYAPLLGLMYLLLIYPIRIYALLTIREQSWVSR